MAVFTSFGSRYESVCFHRGGNWPGIGVPHNLKELSDTCRLARNPSRGSRSNVTLYALKPRMRRILMCHELRGHYMTRLTAKLRSFHVLDSPIGQLRSDDHVEKSRKAQKPHQPPQRCLAIKDTVFTGGQPAFPKVNPERNQQESRKKYDRQNQENDNSDVW